MIFQQVGLEVEGQGCLVPDGLLQRVAAEVSLLVLFRAKCPERVPVDLVDGRPGQAEQERIGEGFPHLPSETSFLS